MPINNDLIPKKSPMPIRFNEKPTTAFKNALESIKVTLVQSPSFDEIKEYCIPFANATWSDDPMSFNTIMDDRTKDLVMHKVFNYQILPTTMETIRCNFLIEGIGLQEVTHILRHRRAVFSAECSADKWWTHKNSLTPTSVENSPDFYERWKKIVLETKQLYCDMIDSKQISIMDARNILPRCLETYYFMSMSLKDTLMFINDRIDKQIQPYTDNIIAYQMILELVKKYPILVKTLNKKFIHKPAKFFVMTARQNRSTNLFQPDKDSDIFEWNEKDFIYNGTRDEINGEHSDRQIFSSIFANVEKQLEEIEKEVDEKYPAGFFERDVPTCG